MDEGTRPGVIQPQDFWKLYVTIYFLTMLVVLIYLLCAKHTTPEIKNAGFIEFSQKDDAAVFVMGMVAFLLNFRFGEAGVVLYIPVLCYFAMRFLLTGGKMNIYMIVAFLGGLYCIYRISYSRYLLVE